MLPFPSIAVALALLLCIGGSARAQQDDDLNAIDDLPHVTIVGAASTEMVPDLAEISLGIHAERTNAGDATAEMARVTGGLIDAAKARGAEARDLRTETVTLAEVYDELRDAAGASTGRRLRGYAAEETLVVRTRALAGVGALTQALVSAGATRLDGISFTVDHPEAATDKLLAEAVRDAQRKASLSAAALGSHLGRVLLIERPQSDTGGVAPQRGFRAALAAPVPAEPGTRTLHAEIEVTWMLEP